MKNKSTKKHWTRTRVQFEHKGIKHTVTLSDVYPDCLDYLDFDNTYISVNMDPDCFEGLQDWVDQFGKFYIGRTCSGEFEGTSECNYKQGCSLCPNAKKCTGGLKAVPEYRNKLHAFYKKHGEC